MTKPDKPSASAPARVAFRTTVLASGKTATGIVVPDALVAKLGPSKRPAVRVTINDHTYRSTIATMEGKFMVGVSAEQRAKTGVKAGDTVDVTLELDVAPREVTVPADLARALAGDAKASGFFDSISYSNKRWYVLWIESAKKAETRDARVSKAIDMLREGRKQG